jgi:hypothetical protein
MLFFILNSRIEQGTRFSLSLMMKRKSNFSFLAKSLFKSAIDLCILPGTSNGTEILVLYARQWAKEISIVSIAVISIMSLADSSSGLHITNQQTIVEPDNHI